MPYKMSENISESLDFSFNSVDFSWFSGVNKRWVISRRQQSMNKD